MEAAIAEELDDSPFVSEQVATVCNQIADLRVSKAVALLAAGASWKETVFQLNIRRETLWRLCQRYPIIPLAAMEVEMRARPALVRLTANVEDAAEVIVRHTRGEIDPEKADIERMQFAAAQATFKAITKLLERAGQQGGLPPPPEVTAKVRDLTEPELVAAAREAQRLRKGGK